MEIEKAALDTIRTLLLGQQSTDVIRLMQHKSLSWDLNQIPQAAFDSAHNADWFDPESETLTQTGVLVADACREYQFWLERDKALPFEGCARYLTGLYFKEKAVLEIGSGLGANLMSLSFAGARVSGIEPVTAYVQLGDIFFEREGLTAPPVLQGAAETVPLPDQSVDVVLCVTAHQYFDLRIAVPEFHRLLRPGGELIIVGATLPTFLKGELSRVSHGQMHLKGTAVTLVNTLSYQILGARLLKARGPFSTSRPIYPSQSAMHRWLTRVGLDQASPCLKVGSEMCFHYRRS